MLLGLFFASAWASWCEGDDCNLDAETLANGDLVLVGRFAETIVSPVLLRSGRQAQRVQVDEALRGNVASGTVDVLDGIACLGGARVLVAARAIPVVACTSDVCPGPFYGDVTQTIRHGPLEDAMFCEMTDGSIGRPVADGRGLLCFDGAAFIWSVETCPQTHQSSFQDLVNAVRQVARGLPLHGLELPGVPEVSSTQ